MLKNNILQGLKLYLNKWEYIKYLDLVELIKSANTKARVKVGDFEAVMKFLFAIVNKKIDFAKLNSKKSKNFLIMHIQCPQKSRDFLFCNILVNFNLKKRNKA